MCYNTLFVGYSWWGAGPRDFARLAPKPSSFLYTSYLSGLRRRLITKRLNEIRMGAALELLPERIDLVLILQPHSIRRDNLRVLRSKCSRMVAWIGDVPVGARDFSDSHAYFDCVVAPDTKWSQSGSVANQQVPWPHLVDKDLQATAARRTLSRTRLVMVGTAYPERIEGVAELRRRRIAIETIGSGWPAEFESRPAMRRTDLLKYLANQDVCVINHQHEQMRDTLNPFFFDLAACGIPQVVVNGTPTSGLELPVASIDSMHQLTNANTELAVTAAKGLMEWSLLTASVSKRIEQIRQILSS